MQRSPCWYSSLPALPSLLREIGEDASGDLGRHVARELLAATMRWGGRPRPSYLATSLPPTRKEILMVKLEVRGISFGTQREHPRRDARSQLGAGESFV